MRRLLLTSAVIVGACGQAPVADLGATGARLVLDYGNDTDVVGFRFNINRTACDTQEPFEPITISEDVDLANAIYPGMVELIEERPFDQDSRHLGAEFFVSLPAGCYDVTAEPSRKFKPDGSFMPSRRCEMAVARLTIEPSQVSELSLISQCDSQDAPGNAAIFVGLNHPPKITVALNRFSTYECEPRQICAYGVDPDNDPIEFQWAQLSGQPIYGFEPGPTKTIAYEGGHAVVEQCATIVARYTGKYDFKISAIDLAYEGAELMSIESITGQSSRGEANFPLYVNWIEEPLCFDDVGSLVSAPGSEILRAPGCEYTSAQEYYCGGDWAPPKAPEEVSNFVCDASGTLIPETLFPTCH